MEDGVSILVFVELALDAGDTVMVSPSPTVSILVFVELALDAPGGSSRLLPEK